jgi:hypothetical protein
MPWQGKMTAQADWLLIQNLVERRQLKELTFQNKKIYLRNWRITR